MGSLPLGQGYDIAETDCKGEDLAVHHRRGLRHMRHDGEIRRTGRFKMAAI